MSESQFPIENHHNFFFENLPVRIVMDDDGEPWWIAKDVCDILELAKPESALRKLDDDEKQVLKVYASGQEREMLAINESGLYTLIIRSNKPQAKPFRRWVTHEVLPSIRRTGSYAVPGSVSGDFKERIERLELLTEDINVQATCIKVQLSELAEVRAAEAGPINDFCDRALVVARGAVVKKADVYDAYLTFCDDQGLVSSGKSAFFKEIYDSLSWVRPVRRTVDGRGVACLKGLRLRGGAA